MKNLQYNYINNNKDLIKAVEEYENSEVLALDTEFIRTSTYFPILGLIQVYDGKKISLIDPISLELDLFWDFLKRSKAVKVIHSASEDLEIFIKDGNFFPENYFDSQIAASVLGMGANIGYATLVKQLLNIEIDKSESRTDWLHRPLSNSQLEYASTDVYYLHKIYFILQELLINKKRLDWVFAEGEVIKDQKLALIDYDNAYLKIRNNDKLNQKSLAFLKSLATWRLKTAIKEDKAINFIIKEQDLLEIAKIAPRNKNQIYSLSFLNHFQKNKYAEEIVKTIIETKLSPPIPLIVPITKYPEYKRIYKKMKSILLEICTKEDLPEELFCSKRYIHQYIFWIINKKETNLPILLKGWRAGFIVDALKSLD